MRIIHADIA